jgi:DNA end-binding protein Ku
MRAAGKVAVVKWTSRGSEHLGVLQVDGQGFILKTLEFASAVRPNDAEVLPADIPADTVAKAAMIIDQKMNKPFDYTSIKSTYNDAIRDVIERMAAGEEVAIEEVAAPVTDNVDSALDAMLGSTSAPA